MIADAEVILKIAGMGSYLHIGCGRSALVFELLKRSIDAYGIDRSVEVIAKQNEKSPGRFYQGSLINYPFQTQTFDTIVIGSELLTFSPHEMVTVLKAVRSIAKRHLVIYFSPEERQEISLQGEEASRLFWEKTAILAGFRRHPREMLVNPYQELENEQMGSLLFFETISEEANKRFPMEWLLANRDLHMDMLREAGRRSDAHVSRYVYAAAKVRPGDVVLDAACGLGYGTAVLAACSPGAQFIGVDIDAESIDYASSHFASTNPAISYRASDVTTLSFIPDHSVDIVVSFETIEHVKDYEAFLTEVKRVLKPDGRFVGSVPNLWCDETGKDPNPHHFHVFDWSKLKAAMEKHFIIDERVAQIAGGGYKLRNGRRIMHGIPVNYVGHLETEWWVVSACVDPTHAKEVPYTNPFHYDKSQTLPDHIDIAKYYDNPWLYRTMVQIGERLADRQVLSDFCSKVAREARAGSADQGAALCVIAYQLLESGDIKINDVIVLIDFINTFERSCDHTNLHAYRWLISLHYVGARLLLTLGKRDEAVLAFAQCAEMDPSLFSPLLATKTISSRMYLGLIQASQGNIAEAKDEFIKAIKQAHHVLQGDWNNIVGNLDYPLSFGLPETAEVLDIASQCAQALHALDHQQTVPGYFWDRINLKRFGLVEWNKSLERENHTLRHHILRQQTARTQSEAAIA
jgi:ubiquinone/menaquinone biosynthesis C-methylase UbiE